MPELNWGQVQEPAPQNSVDNTQQLCPNCPTQTVVKWYATDAMVWAVTSPDITPLLRQVDVDRCGGVCTMRSVLAYIAQHYPTMYVSESRIAKDLGLARSTVQNCIKGLIQVGLLRVIGHKGRGVKVFDLPLYEQSYELQQTVTSTQPDRHSLHKQNKPLTVTRTLTKTTTKTDLDNVVYSISETDYLKAIEPLRPHLKPEFNLKVQRLVSETLELEPKWKTDLISYGQRLRELVPPNTNSPGGVVEAMQLLRDQKHQARPMHLDQLPVQSDQVELDPQEIFNAIMDELEPQQRCYEYQAQALDLIQQIRDYKPYWIDPKGLAEQVRTWSPNDRNARGTLSALTSLANYAKQ